MAAAMIMFMLPPHVGVEHPVHPAAQIAVVFGADHQMKMVGHQTIPENRIGISMQAWTMAFRKAG